MTFRVDDRARVPFALIGVVILLASTGYAVTWGAPAPTDHVATTDAIRETTAATRSALHGAIRRAGARAARHPVLKTANTSWGRVLDDDIPYRSAFRLRIAVAVRKTLHAVGERYGDVHTTVSLPPVSSPAQLRAAMQNVSIDRLNRSRPRVQVTIDDVTITARRNGRVIATERQNLTVTVRTPVFILHDRVETFQRRLNQSPWTAGFARQFTARLYALAWARAYAQYSGVPVENVVANRHLEVAANGALLAVQRSVFGTDDATARSAYRTALAQTGARDLLSAADVGLGDWTDSVLDHRSIDPPDPGPLAGPTALNTTTPVTVPLGPQADTAFTAFLEAEGNRSLTGAIASVFRAVAHVETSRTLKTRRRDPAATPSGWTLVDTTEHTTTSVTETEGPTPSTTNRSTTLVTYHRRVIVRTETVKTWQNGTRTKTTTGTSTETWTVRLAVRAHLPYLEAVQGAVDPAARRAAIDTVADTIVSRLVTDRGGPTTLSRSVALGTYTDRTITVELPVPEDATDTVYHAVSTLRSRLANRTIQVAPASVTTGTVSDRLTTVLDNLTTQDRRNRSFQTLTAKASALARVRYLDRMRTQLTERGADNAAVLEAFASLLGTNGIDPRHLAMVGTFLDGPRGSTAGTPLNYSVAGVPAYLTRTRVTNASIPGLDQPYYPLATRNLNLVTVPYDDAAAAVTAPVLDDGDQVALGTAARALRIANRTLRQTTNETLHAHRDALLARVDARVDTVGDKLVTTIHESTPLTRDVARQVVVAAMHRWQPTHALVAAALNGSLARTVLTKVATRAGLDPRSTDRLGVRLRHRVRSTVADLRLPAGPLTTVTETAHGVARQAVAAALDRGRETVTDDWIGGALTAARGGVPLLPLPGYWYATANAWRVQVNGSYARFGVAAPFGAPLDGGSAMVEYVRESGGVRVDVDGDGERERIGQNTRVRFAVDTAIIVVVPPGRGGVADVDGDRDERSPGWNETTSNL